MIHLLRARLHQKHRTIRYPDGPPPALAGALPRPAGVRQRSPAPRAARTAPTPVRPARSRLEPALDLDLGKCLFCGECAAACPTGKLRFGADYRLAARHARRPRRRRAGERAPGGGARRQDPPALRALAEAARGERRRLQRLRVGCQRAADDRLGHRPLRHPDRRLAAPRRRPDRHRPGHREHAPGPAEDLRGGARRRRS